MSFGDKIMDKVLIGIVVMVVFYIFFGLMFSFFPFNIIKHNMTSEKITQNYEMFYDLNNQIKAYDKQIADKEEMMKQIDKNDKEMYNKFLIELTGLKNVRANAVAEYNSNSKKINRNIWKAPDLPYILE